MLLLIIVRIAESVILTSVCGKMPMTSFMKHGRWSLPLIIPSMSLMRKVTLARKLSFSGVCLTCSSGVASPGVGP